MYDERWDTWAPGAHTGTFRGNQLAFAAGAETIRIFRRDDVLGNVRRRGKQIARTLAGLRDNPWVREVRGRGLMWGIELADPLDGQPCGALAGQIQAAALRRGLILELGRHDCVVRMLPPLNVTAEVVDTACSILLDVRISLISWSARLRLLTTSWSARVLSTRPGGGPANVSITSSRTGATGYDSVTSNTVTSSMVTSSMVAMLPWTSATPS